MSKAFECTSGLQSLLWPPQLSLMRVLCLLLVSMGQTGCGVRAPGDADSASYTASATTPVTCSQPEWYFGAIDASSTRVFRHTFVLTNRSPVVVTVDDVRSDCGCLVSENPPSEISPGGHADLTVQVTVADRPGPFSRNVLLRFGTTPPTFLRLAVRGHIQPTSALYSVPRALDFGKLKDGERKRRLVTIGRYDESELQFSDASPSSRALSASIEPARGRSPTLNIAVALDSSTLQPGHFDGSVAVRTSATEKDNAITIPVRALVVTSRHGLVDSILVSRLRAGESQDVVLAKTGIGGRAIGCEYEGDSAISVELLHGGNSSSGGEPLLARITHVRSTSGQPRICEGVLNVRVDVDTIRIPLCVHLLP